MGDYHRRRGLEKQRKPFKDTDSGYTGVVAAAMYMPASATVYNPLDGTYGGTTTEDPDYIAKYGSNFADIHGDAVNPVRLLEAETAMTEPATSGVRPVWN